MCPAAAFAMRNYANEMVYARTPAGRAGERINLNTTSLNLRTWHEQLLFASSTSDVGSVRYTSKTAVPTYRATPVVMQVLRFLLSIPPVWADMLTLGFRQSAFPP